MAEQTSNNRQHSDTATISAATDVLTGESRKKGLARLWPFLGPAFIASVAYVDPGNFATNIQGGAKFGYTLLWVVVGSNLMAMLIQSLSAKLGIATGRNLAELCRLHFPRPLVWLMWVLMEVVAMATDLAEFLGAALGFNLLFGIPLWAAGLLTALATFLILSLQVRGFRPLEAVITGMVGVIAVCYLVETILDKPDWKTLAYHAVVPQFAGPESVLLAAGILGATVMPHVIFLHSALTQDRIVVDSPVLQRRLFRFEMVDVCVAMGVAGFVNAAMLIMAAATFNRAGLGHVATIEEAYITLEPLLGIGGALHVRHLAAGLGAFLLGRRHHVGAGDHAGIPGAAHPGLGAPPGHHPALAGGDLHRPRPDAHAGDQPGGAELRAAVCGHPAGALHTAARPHGRAGQPPVDHRCRPGWWPP